MAYSTQANLEARIGVKQLAELTNDNSNLYVFTVSGITTDPTAGAVYTNNAQTFTVVSVSLSGTAGARLGTLTASFVTGVPTSSGTLTKSSGTGDSTIAFSAVTASDTTIVAALILRADTYIDNALNGVYAVPFSSTPALIAQYSCDLACYYAMQRRYTSAEISDSWNNIFYEIAGNPRTGVKGALDRLADLDDVLNDATPIYSSGVVIPPTTLPIVDFNDTTNEMHYY